jgi:hypothetical protein
LLHEFYVSSLGSARETKGRIYRAREFYTGDVRRSRLVTAGQVAALILTEINRQRRR